MAGSALFIGAGPIFILMFAFVVGPSQCGFFSITEQELLERLKNDKLAPEEVYKLVKKCNGDKADLTLNGVTGRDLIDLTKGVSIENCDNTKLMAKIELSKTASGGPLASVASYCRERVAALISLCASDIEDLAEQSLAAVATHELDTLRVLLNKHFNKPDAGFKLILDEYFESHEFDRPAERKHADLDNSCHHMMGAFEPIKVILERSHEFGVAPTKNEIVLGWIDAYRMCEFYLANYK